MKKTLLILILVALYSGVTPALSVPAAPRNFTLEQADGSTFEAKLWGDEISHGTETIDGYSIVFDETTRDWNYATISADGNLVSSKNSVGRVSSQAFVQKHLRPTTQGRSNIKGFKTLAAPEKTVSPSGTANVPVILINFHDRTTTYNAANFNNLLFGSSVKSMKDFYKEASYGAFTVSAGPSGIAGWYQASKGHDYYGQNDAYGYDKWPGTLVREAVAAADASYNFAPYDLNGDCYVDVIDLVHQGSGEESGTPATDIWSHSWDLNSAKYYGYSDGGEYTTNDVCTMGGHIKVNAYVIQPEILWGGQQTMGVFAHEYGHALGAPDLYDTDYSSQGIGYWSLMAGGSWNGITQQGDTPAQMDAWTKSFLGWVSPKIITKNNLTQIKQVENNSEVYQLRDPTGPGEYFLVENRRKVGFDAALPGEGLLIWHIDETQNTNDIDTRRKVDLEESDGNDNPTQSTDPWKSNVIGFTQSTNPNSRLYNGSDTGVRVTGISGSGSLMTAYFTINPLPVPVPTFTVVSPNGLENWTRGTTQTIKWNSTGSPGSYVKIELLKSGIVNRIINASTPNDGSHPWLILATQAPGKDYKVRITSTTNAAYNDTSDKNFTIPIPTITVVFPNGTESWVRGTTQTIKWNSTGSPGAYVKIELLKSGIFNRIIIASTPNDGIHPWPILATQSPGKDYKVKITSTTNAAYNDTSDKNFTIPVPSTKVVSPNGLQNWTLGTTQTITWNSTENPKSYVKIELLRPNVTNKVIIASTLNDGSHPWLIPANQIRGNTYKIKVSSTANLSNNDTSDNNFNIIPPKIIVTSPNGGQNWVRNSIHPITWNYTGSPGTYVKIELLKNGLLNRTILTSTPNDKLQNWTIPITQAPGTDYKIRITSTTNLAYNDTSANNFTISSS